MSTLIAPSGAVIEVTFAEVRRHLGVELEFRTGRQDGGKRNFSPAPAYCELLSSIIYSNGVYDGRICLAGLALRPATDVIIRKIQGGGGRGARRRMIVRRALQTGIITKLGCHTFRATGITVYLPNVGLLNMPSRWQRTRFAGRSVQPVDHDVVIPAVVT